MIEWIDHASKVVKEMKDHRQARIDKGKPYPPLPEPTQQYQPESDEEGRFCSHPHNPSPKC